MLLPPLHTGVLLRRYKRFLADVRLDSGEEVVAHCPNPGRMTSCAAPGCRVWLSHHASPRRKLKWTWELSELDGTTVLVNTARPNAVVEEAVRAGAVPALQGYASLRREVRYGERSRVDLLLEDPGRCYVEVKSVTLRVGPGEGAFPDAVTARGARHAAELAAQVAEGHRAVLFFLVSRGDVDVIRPADEIDPAYGVALRAAVDAGVELLAHRAEVGPGGISVGPALPIRL
jgi:sugar fermentation stimulation protein A